MCVVYYFIKFLFFSCLNVFTRGDFALIDASSASFFSGLNLRNFVSV